MLQMFVTLQALALATVERLRSDEDAESGATAIEYALIATLIAVAIIVGATALGLRINTVFCNIRNSLGGTGTC